MKNLIVFFIISSMGVYAQAEEVVTDQELKQFASAFQQVQKIDQQSQQNMIKAVEKEGLDVQRFNEIQQAQQTPKQESDVSDEEIKKYETVSKKIEIIQEQAQQKMQQVIKEEGLTLPRYQEISEAIKNNSDLQNKLQEYLQD
ncbi:MAG: DUF4168 domain-containing protein [Bacteroidota bacterium]